MKPTSPFHNPILLTEARTWLLDAVRPPGAHASLAIKFHTWLVSKLGYDIPYPESLVLFLALTAELKIWAVLVGDDLVYVVEKKQEKTS